MERRGSGKAEGGIAHVQESQFPLTLSSLSAVPPPPSVCIPFDLIIAGISYSLLFHCLDLIIVGIPTKSSWYQLLFHCLYLIIVGISYFFIVCIEAI